MVTIDDYKGNDTTWCPGCGNFAILNGIRQALAGLGIAPHQVVMYSGIGQAAKLPLYTRGNVLNGLHGRALPMATGSSFADHTIKTLVFGGDGDGFAEGGNHFLHAIRRNPDIAYIAHNNQVYGLTKGQASPTSDPGFVTGTTPEGVSYERFNPAAVAISLNATFVARTHTGVMTHMVEMMKLAIEHKGFSFLEVLQPCVTYNKVNTLKWYRERSYDLADDKDYDPADREVAWKKALEWGDKFPIGIILRSERPTMTDRLKVLEQQPLNRRPSRPRDVRPLLDNFR
ncbi:MAG: 2-oxoacid:ferredoxin oxidoreductase subunit beta [Candidatus Glassbacteria bacterium]|nr:2-oxoacid:ferredoxin oxidoreductase subunit beta [Candidatus Glassbacteria bacterium]